MYMIQMVSRIQGQNVYMNVYHKNYCKQTIISMMVIVSYTIKKLRAVKALLSSTCNFYCLPVTSTCNSLFGGKSVLAIGDSF